MILTPTPDAAVDANDGLRTVPHPFIDGAVCRMVRMTDEGIDPIIDAWPIEPGEDERGAVGFYMRLGLVGNTAKHGEEPVTPVYQDDCCEVFRTAWEAPMWPDHQ